MEIATARGCLDKTVSYFSRNLSTLDWENARKISYQVAAAWNLRTSYQKLAHEHIVSARIRRHHGRSSLLWRTYSMPVRAAEDRAEDAEDDSEDSPQRVLSQPLSNDKLMSLLADSERKKLMIKLSEANQQNRFLKRQLHVKEDALVGFKTELAVMELEIQALVSLAEEIAQSGIPEGSRKINGKFIQSHLLSRLEAVHEKLKEQIKDVLAVESKEVPLFWCGMAQNVQVMGTFDGWSQGEHLSPEYNGSFTKFSTTLMLRPGRASCIPRPMRFLVNGNDLVASVIDTALKTFAREGRLPVLGFDVDKFLLYCANEGSDALSPSEEIGSCGGRNFLLCKKHLQSQTTEGRAKTVAEKGSGWKAWLNKSFAFKITTLCH